MMPQPATTIRLDMPASIHASSIRSRDFDSSSPYPSSSPSTDSSDAEGLSRVSKTDLRSSIAEISDTKLRSILFKLAGSSPRLERAIRKELTSAQSSRDSPPLTPTSSKARRTNRNRKHRNFKDAEAVVTQEPLVQQPGTEYPSLTRIQDGFLYHTGYLDREVYEFLPPAPQRDVAFTDMRTVTMWSCCDEDEWSPGCMILPPYTNPSNQNQYGRISGEILHSDVFPESDLERE